MTPCLGGQRPSRGVIRQCQSHDDQNLLTHINVSAC